MEKLFETVRELAFKQEKFNRLPPEEQKKETGIYLYPRWNEDYMAEYSKPCEIKFCLENKGYVLSDVMSEMLRLSQTEDRIDGWRVCDVKLSFDVDNGYIDLEVYITSL